MNEIAKNRAFTINHLNLRLSMKIKIFLCSFTLVVLSLLLACGGAGGSSAGQQSVLRVVNVSLDAESLDFFVDGELTFPNVARGTASIFESLPEGDHVIRAAELGGGQRSFELQNAFKFAIPYTIIAANLGTDLRPIVAVNDRSDNAVGLFRVRAINASSSSNLTVRMLSSSNRRIGSAEAVKKILPKSTAQATTTSQTLVTPTTSPVVSATATVLASPSASATVISSSTPTTVPSVSASPTSVPVSATATANATPVQTGNVDVANALNFSDVSKYRNATAGDYRISVESEGKTIYQSGQITFSGGQVISIVINNPRQGEVGVLRLEDRP
jgi:hypothetical protein